MDEQKFEVHFEELSSRMRAETNNPKTSFDAHLDVAAEEGGTEGHRKRDFHGMLPCFFFMPLSF